MKPEVHFFGECEINVLTQIVLSKIIIMICGADYVMNLVNPSFDLTHSLVYGQVCRFLLSVTFSNSFLQTTKTVWLEFKLFCYGTDIRQVIKLQFWLMYTQKIKLYWIKLLTYFKNFLEYRI